MLSGKRVVIATILGLIFGVVAYLLARPMAPEGGIPGTGIVTLILGRGMIGFAIGISACRIGWWLHGIIIGLIFSLPMAFGAVWTGFGWTGLVGTLVLGIVFGFLIELITSVVFKAPVSKAEETPQPA